MPQTLPDSIIDGTIASIREQQRLPASPGELSDAGVSLCAGALLLIETARRCGHQADVPQLARTMIRSGTQSIVGLARRFGLDAELVRLIVLKNDSFEEDARVAGMVGFLASLRQGLPSA
jgi:hypothetical protein